MQIEKVAVIEQALMLYAAKNIDIVDAMLYGYYIIENKEILSFDKQLNKYLMSESEFSEFENFQNENQTRC